MTQKQQSPKANLLLTLGARLGAVSDGAVTEEQFRKVAESVLTDGTRFETTTATMHTVEGVPDEAWQEFGNSTEPIDCSSLAELYRPEATA